MQGFDGAGNSYGIYSDLHKPAILIGGPFAVSSMALSSLLIHQHLRSYTQPAEQKWIVGILFMVPVYACDSTLSLWNPKFSVVWEIFRSCYEAFALYCFGRYLVACLGGDEEVTRLLEDEANKLLSRPLLESEQETNRKSKRDSVWNFLFQPQAFGRKLYTIVKFGLVQYMILKILCAILQLILEMCGVYGDGKWKIYYGYPYITAVLNFSQMWALCCLVQFYNVTHHELQQIRPLAKFITFKAVVFATWWQGVCIALLCYMGILPRTGKFRTGMQDFLICIEMAIAAVAHVYVFSVDPYRYLVVPEHGKFPAQSIKAPSELEQDCEGSLVSIGQAKTIAEAPGTSVAQSVQEVFLTGGEHVVNDVVLTITQAIEPVERSVTKIQETLHQRMTRPERREEDVEAEKHTEENI